VNHDVLMARLAKRIEDKRLLRVIRRYLEAGMMVNGVVVERYEGTPQGGPLSPLMANVLLDEVDRRLEKSGHRFVRYADDCNVYVRSKRAGERVMERLVKLYAKLRLKINEQKSTVARVWERKFLGLQLLGSPGTDGQTPRRAEGPGGFQAAHPGDYEPERRAIAGQGGGGATELSAGLEGILPTRGHSGGLS
jgi:RNA-directed DNA polymerase